MAKKTLIIVTKGTLGGAQQFVLNLAKGMAKKGHLVTVGFGDGDFLLEKLKVEKIDCHQFKYLQRTKNIISNLLFILELKKYIEQNNFSIIHFNSTNSLFGAIGAKISTVKPKTIFTFHGLSYLDVDSKKNLLIKSIFYLFFRICLRFIDKNIFICQSNLDYAKKIKLIKNGEIIANGVENKYLSKNLAKNFLSKITSVDLKDKKIIGSIGRLSYPKNYEFLIKAASRLCPINNDLVFIIIGEGEERTKYERLIKQYNLEKKFFLLGEIREAALYIKAFDIFVLTSEFEGVPMTLLEALDSGVDVLASDVGGIKMVLKDIESIYQPNNLNEFVEKIKNQIDKPKQMTRKSLFSVDIMVDEYLKSYDL